MCVCVCVCVCVCQRVCACVCVRVQLSSWPPLISRKTHAVLFARPILRYQVTRTFGWGSSSLKISIDHPSAARV